MGVRCQQLTHGDVAVVEAALRWSAIEGTSASFAASRQGTMCHEPPSRALWPSVRIGPKRAFALLIECRVATSKAAVRSGRGAAGFKVALAPILAIPVDPATPPDTTFEPNCRLRSLRDFQLHPLNSERSPKPAIRGEHGGLRRRRVSMEMRTLAAPQPMRRYDPHETLPSFPAKTTLDCIQLHSLGLLRLERFCSVALGEALQSRRIVPHTHMLLRLSPNATAPHLAPHRPRLWIAQAPPP